MDFAALADAASNLLDKFESLSRSAGSGLSGEGPAPVPPELERRFSEIMTGESDRQAVSGDASAEMIHEASTEPSSGIGVQDGSGAVKPPSADASAASLPTPAELYALQFRIGMVRFQAEYADQVRRKTSQDLDSFLRAQS